MAGHDAAADVATMGLQLEDGETVLKIEAHDFPAKIHLPLFGGYMGAYQRTLTCRYLIENYPDIREELIDSYLNDEVVLKYAPRGLGGDCATTEGWTFANWWINPYTRVSPLAFTGACTDITSTLFHEMIHRERLLASEEQVTRIEKECLPE